MRHSNEDIKHALQSSKVLLEPDHRISTFGSTNFLFIMISELMDEIDQVRVRIGEVEACKPKIVQLDPKQNFSLEGFSSKAEGYLKGMKNIFDQTSLLKYGFSIRCFELREEIVHSSLGQVRSNILEDSKQKGNPSLAVIEGVDESWEAGLLKLTLRIASKSMNINFFDFKKHGLL